MKLATIWRVIAWYLRELYVWLDFRTIAYGAESLGAGRKILFLDDSNNVRRGAMFSTNRPVPYQLFVCYVAYNKGQSSLANTYLHKSDENMRWTYGWNKESGKALLAAEALR